MSPSADDPVRGMSLAEAAAWWFLRIQRGSLESAETRAFETWLENEGAADAFDRARTAWSVTGDAAELPRMRALRTAALARVRPRRPATRWLPAAAAALVLLVGAGFVFGGMRLDGLRDDSLARLGDPDFVTLVGQRQTVSLPDGSAVTLNTDSALDVAFGGDMRVVRLIKGQAYFEVARDADRPFMVEAAGRRILAVGTAFDVRLDPDRFQVVLVEGGVRVGRSPYGFDGEERAQIELQPGEGLIARLGAPEEVMQVNVARQLRWREGFVEFDGEALVNVVAEMNRYTNAPLSVQDPRVAALRVSGVFRTDDQSQFLNVIRTVLPVDTRLSGMGTTELVWSARDDRG